MSVSISILLKSFRQINNLSQAQVAEYLGIGAPAYNHYETGAREPNVTVLRKLAQLYHLEDQILGVSKADNTQIKLAEKYSLLDLHKRIISSSDEYALQSKYEKKKIVLLPSQYEALCDYFSRYSDYKKNVFIDIASSKAGNDGKMYEALTYAWLERQGILFAPQQHINANECLNPHGYVADGIIDESVVFDIKMFGITHPNISRLQSKLNQLNNNKHDDYFITISGSVDLSNSKIQELLSHTAVLYQNLFLDENKHRTDYWYSIPDTNLKIRATCTADKKFISTVSEFNPFKWAMENQYYFFHDASQFCTDKPFIIICPYDSKTAGQFTGSFSASTLAAFRSLCRRMFLGMPNEIDVNEYDESCPPLISVKAASQCISVVIFQDISMFSDNDDTWVFINPNARNMVPRYIMDQFRYHTHSMLEDFCYDNY